MAEGNMLLSCHESVVYAENFMLRLHNDYTSVDNVRYLISDEKALLFITSNGVKKYIHSIENDGRIIMGDDKKFWDIVRNDKGMFSIKVDNCFLSNRLENNSVCLMPHNLDWECYYDVESNPRLYNKIITQSRVEVYDCFPFFNEYELLELRLNTLFDYVDYFVIVEMNRTQNNEPKDWNFLKEQERYSKYSDKIRYIQVTDEVPFSGLGDWSIENFQRNAIMRGLEDAKANDVIFISDCDEIWNPKTYKDIVNNKADFFINLSSSGNSKQSFEFSLSSSEVPVLEYFPIAMRQKMYMYRINWRVDSPLWNGSILVRRKNLSIPQDLRNGRYQHITAKNGGWHFTWQGGEEKIKRKIKSVVEGNMNIDERDGYWKGWYYGEGSVFSHVEVDLSELGLEGVEEFCRKYPQFYGNKNDNNIKASETKSALEKPLISNENLLVETHQAYIGWHSAVLGDEISGDVTKDWALEAVRHHFSSPVGKLTYRVFDADGKGSPLVGEGEMAGTVGQAKPIHGIAIGLDNDKFHVRYRVHVIGFGWSQWVKDGEGVLAKYPLNGLQVVVD